jgi:hypothetical protein
MLIQFQFGARSTDSETATGSTGGVVVVIAATAVTACGAAAGKVTSFAGTRLPANGSRRRATKSDAKTPCLSDARERRANNTAPNASTRIAVALMAMETIITISSLF